MKVMIWGTGKYCDMLMMEALWKDGIEITGFCESKRRGGENYKKEYRGTLLNVYSLEDLNDSLYDVIFLAHSYYEDVDTLAEQYKIEKDKIIIPYTTGKEKSKLEVINRVVNYIGNAEEVVSLLSLEPHMGDIMLPSGHDILDYSLLYDRELVKEEGYYFLKGDYARVRTLELCIKEIRRKNLQGAVAEVGVFDGSFAQVLAHYFPEKELYLYDTFEGFPECDSKNEIENRSVSVTLDKILKNVNLEKVKKRIGNYGKCHYRVGYFPGTVEKSDKEEKYCLVSLDADLYAPMYAGLEFFYPRLEEGGYIFVHEYNGNFLLEGEVLSFSGVKKALNDFESNYGHVCYVPISDRNGSLIITK